MLIKNIFVIKLLLILTVITSNAEASQKLNSKSLGITVESFTKTINKNFKILDINLIYEPKSIKGSFYTKFNGKYIRNTTQLFMLENNYISGINTYLDTEYLKRADYQKVLRALIMTISNLKKDDILKALPYNMIFNDKFYKEKDNKFTLNMNINNSSNKNITRQVTMLILKRNDTFSIFIE